MYRWHQERNLMLRRWRQELGIHVSRDFGYTLWFWHAPASCAVDVDCHCARGIGTMRKQSPLDGANSYWKRWEPKRRQSEEREAIRFELEAET